MKYEDKKTNYWPMVIGVVLVIAIIGGVLWWRSNNESKSSNSSDATANVTSTPTNSPASPTAIPTVMLTPTPSSSTSIITVTPTVLDSTKVTATPFPQGPTEVKVYYSQNEIAGSTDSNSFKDPTYAVYRLFNTSRADRETFVLEQEIAGPSASDKSKYNWFTSIVLTGESNCGSKDFTLTKTADSLTYTVKFCKAVTSNGVGDDARVKYVVGFGIKQFAADPSLVKITILTKDDNCFGDASGANKCKV